MRIRALRAEGWRNLEPLALSPSAGVIVLSGDNGQGKTNVVEAIYYLAGLRSWRTTDAADLVRRGASTARLSADVESGPLVRRLEVALESGRRTVLLDGKRVRGAAALFGGLGAVLFAPEHLLIPRAAPALRRKLLDLAVFGQERAFYREAAAYQRVVRSRNALLRRGAPDPNLLDTYDEAMARAGARIVVRRRIVVADLAPRVEAIFKRIHGDLGAELRYRSDPSIEAATDEASLFEAISSGLRARRGLDERRRVSGYGPHTDDVEMRLSGQLIREHGSQGQIRSFVLALKIAELEALAARLGEMPILLLDDVASELDAERRKYLFERIGDCGAQTVITTTDPAAVPALPDRQDFRVVKGQIIA